MMATAAPAAAPHRGSQRGRQCALHGGLSSCGEDQLHQLEQLRRRRLPRGGARRVAGPAHRWRGRRGPMRLFAACAQVFAAMGYDAWALNADDLDSTLGRPRTPSSPTPPAAPSPWRRTTTRRTPRNTRISAAPCCWRCRRRALPRTARGIAVAIAAARDAGIDFDTTPVILSVNGISTADITDLGASSAAAAAEARRGKHGGRPRDRDGHPACPRATTNWAGDQVIWSALSASTQVQHDGARLRQRRAVRRRRSRAPPAVRATITSRASSRWRQARQRSTP